MLKIIKKQKKGNLGQAERTFREKRTLRYWRDQQKTIIFRGVVCGGILLVVFR